MASVEKGAADAVAAWPEGAPRPAEPAAFSSDAVHLLRTTQQIQYQLSQMADSKASMLLGITFVIFTLSLSQARVGGGPPPLPVMILGGAAFVAATLTVIAVLPAVGGGQQNEPNILFFGVFTKMSQEAYVAALLQRLGESQSVYETFARDIYQNGRLLAGKKYRLLVWAYSVLLVGLFASLIAFVAPFVAHWFKF